MTTDPTAGQARPATARELRAARLRAERRAEHFAAKRAAAGTPRERVAVAWDQWRAMVRDVPDAEADRLAEQITAALAQQIDHMTTLQGDRP